MSTPLVQLPVFPFPTITPGTTSPFSTAQQNSLTQIANGIGGFNSTIQSSGATDLWNAEQSLVSNNKTLAGFVPDWISLDNILKNNNAAATLTNLVVNPTNFIVAALPANLVTLNNDNTLAGNLKILDSILSASAINTFVSEILNSSTVIGNLASFGGGPTGFIAGLFSGTNLNNNVTPKQIVTDLISDPSSFTADFTKALFNTHPIYNNVTPLDVMNGLVFAGTGSFPTGVKLTGVSGSPTAYNWGQILAALFSTSAAGDSTPQQLMYDMFTHAGNVAGDIEAIIKPSMSSWLPGVFPSTPVVSGLTGAVSPSGWISDLFKGSTSIVDDLLNMASLNNLKLSVSVPLDSLLGTWFKKFLSNIFTIPNPAYAFVGMHPSANTNGYWPAVTESIAYGVIPSGKDTSGRPSVPGWGYSVGPPSWPSNLNGAFQGYLGFLLACTSVASGAGEQAVHSFNNWVSAGTPWAAGADIVNALKKTGDSIFAAGYGMIAIMQIVSQMAAAILNINNVLNNAGIPTGPASDGSNFPLSRMTALVDSMTSS